MHLVHRSAVDLGMHHQSRAIIIRHARTRVRVGKRKRVYDRRAQKTRNQGLQEFTPQSGLTHVVVLPIVTAVDLVSQVASLQAAALKFLHEVSSRRSSLSRTINDSGNETQTHEVF